MKHGDTQLGTPQVPYKNTKANIEALIGIPEGAIAYATDTNELGSYDGAAWQWHLANPVEYIEFDTNPLDVPKQTGILSWNITDGTLDLQQDGATQQMGQELYIKCANKTGVLIAEGKAVYISGSQGNRPTIALAKADSESTSHAVGITTMDVLNNQEGFVTIFGYVRQINTTGGAEAWAEGDKLYLSATVAGALTNINPLNGYHNTRLAVVTNVHANQGSILINVQNHIDHTLAEHIYMPAVSNPTLQTLKDHFNTNGSAGVADGTQTYVTIGSTALKISIVAGEGYIRTSNDQQAPLVFCKWNASPDIYTFSAPAAGQEIAIFFGVSYNAGNPIAIYSATFSDFNGYDKFWLGRASYDGTTVEILNTYAHAEDLANNTRTWMRRLFPFQREQSPEGTGGLELSVSLLALAMSAGAVWHGYNRYLMSAIASGTAFRTYYKRAGGGFNMTSGVTNFPNTQYDDGSGTLATMTANRYGTLWVYLDVATNTLDVLYGAVNATSVALAQADTAPTVPAHLTYHGKLISRIIFQKSGATATLIESAWSNVFSASAVGDHALLSNLQGGTAGEYYHLTNERYTYPPIAETNVNNIFRCDSPGGDSSFVGTIATLPGGATLTYNITSGNEGAMVPNSTSHLAKMRLYNTTRGTSALISNCVTGTNTITLTANVPAGWVVGDTITIASQTVSGGALSWVDLEITSGPTNKTSVFMKLQCTSSTVGDTLRTHPFSASFSTSKYDTCAVLVSGQTTQVFALVNVITNIFSISWSGTPTNVNIREAGYLQ